MAAFTTTPTPAGEGPSLFGIAKSIGAKIRDAAEQAKEEKEKAVKSGESPKKGSLFKSALKNQFNPIKSKKAKGNWNKQFSWNQKSDKPDAVNGKPTGGGGESGGKTEKLKNFIAGGFSAILTDTTQMVGKLSAINDATNDNLSATSRSSTTLVAIKDLVDTQTDLRRESIENQKRAASERSLEKTNQVGKTSDPSSALPKLGGDGEGGGGEGGGFDLFGTLLGGLEGVESIMQIRNLLGAGKAASGIGAGAAAGIVGGVGLGLSAGGEGMFQLGQMGDKSLKDRRKSIDEKKARGENTFLDEALQVGQTGVGEIGKTLGVAMDVGGAPFRYAIEALRNPFLSPEQKEEQAYNLAKMDTRIREHSRGWMNRIDFMNVIPDQKGGFGNIYGNEAATQEMAGKMSAGGMIKLANGGTASIVDNPTKLNLGQGSGVIPLNRNEGKDFKESLMPKKSESPEDTAINTVGAMILGVSAGLLGKTESGTVGDQVKQDISKAAREFGISNLTFTSSIGKGEFGKVDVNKNAKDFMSSLFSGLKISGSKGKEKGGGGGTPPTGSVAEAAKSMSGMSAQEADVRMDKMDKVLTDAGIPNAIMGTPGVAGDSVTEAWCAQFVATVLAEKNYKPPNNALADSYAPGKWGETVDPKEAKAGDIITIDYSGKKKEAHHVAVVTGNDGTTISYTGGNQGSTGSSLTNKVTDGTMKVTDPNLLGITRPKETLSSSSPQARDAQQTAQATNLSGSTETASQMPTATVTPLVKPAQDGMVGPSWMPWNWGKVVDKHRSAKSTDYANPNGMLAQAAKRREMMKELGYQGGGSSMDVRHRHAAKLREQRASQQRAQLGVVRGGGKNGRYTVTNTGMRAGESEEDWSQRTSQAIRLANRLNKEQGLNRPKPKPVAPVARPRPAAAPRPAQRPASRSSSGGSSSGASTAVVNNTMTLPSTTSGTNASASGSYGAAVPGNKTRSMGFADFLYEDLV
jgi:hypothetical protein